MPCTIHFYLLLGALKPTGKTIMKKNILKNIAKEWCQGILLACETDAFGDAIEEGALTEEEAGFIVSESHKVARRITKEQPMFNVGDIIGKYYQME